MKIVRNCFIMLLEVVALWNHTILTFTTNFQSEDGSSVDFISREEFNSTRKPTSPSLHLIFNQNDTRLPITKRLRKPCLCQNGGSCIRRLPFCECPDGFTGRFCQNKLEYRSCGNLRHGDIIYDTVRNCNICHCFDGELICDNSFLCEDVTDLVKLLITPQHGSGTIASTFNFVIFCLIFAICQISMWI